MDLNGAIGLIGGIVGIIGLIISWQTKRAAAKKDEVEALRGIIGELRAELERWKKKYEQLEAKYNRLVEWARGKGLEPFQEDGAEGE